MDGWTEGGRRLSAHILCKGCWMRASLNGVFNALVRLHSAPRLARITHAQANPMLCMRPLASSKRPGRTAAIAPNRASKRAWFRPTSLQHGAWGGEWGCGGFVEISPSSYHEWSVPSPPPAAPLMRVAIP
jgi:hypothetical protein